MDPRDWAQQALEALPLAIFAKDANHEFRYVFWNTAAERLCGLTREQVLGKTDREIFPEATARQRAQLDLNALDSRETSSVAEESPIEGAAGSPPRWVRSVRVALNLGAERVLVLGFAEDISFQVERRRRDEVNRALFKSVLNHLPVEVTAKDPEGRYVFANRQFCDDQEVDRSNLIGRTDAETFPPETAKRLAKNDRHAFQMRTVVEFEEVFRASEEEQTQTVMKFPILDVSGDVSGTGSIVIDTTERRKARAALELERAKSLSQAKMASLGEMTGAIAHEINNPLAIICGKSQLLAAMSKMGKITPEKTLESAQKIEETANRIVRIVKGLRMFTRDGQADPYERRSVGEIVADLVEFCRYRFNKQKMELRVGEIPADLTLECKTVQVAQVLLNLLNNSLDACRELEERWVAVDARDLGESIEITVTDSGKGIAPDIAEHMMEPFFTTKPVGKGTGLGLSISRGIVERHLGTLELDPRSPNTRFVITLPKSQGAAPAGKAA